MASKQLVVTLYRSLLRNARVLDSCKEFKVRNQRYREDVAALIPTPKAPNQPIVMAAANE